MDGNNKLPVLIFLIPLLIFIGIIFLNNSNKTANPQISKSQDQGASTKGYNFSANEIPTFKFPSVAYASDLQKNITILNSSGKQISADITASGNEKGTSIQLNKAQSFMPGKYSIVISQNGKQIKQDFTWGVLAINPNKSIYSVGEFAKLSIAVLDEKGAMVCDANMNLVITDPTGQTTTLSTQNETIIVNPECSQKKYTVNPDFETKYQVKSQGKYQMSLTAVTKNGTYNIKDSFSADNTAEFDVERTIATRIFPYSIYPVSIKIIAKKDFTGQIREFAPASFAITPLENTTAYSSIQKNNQIQNILWDISLKKGETINIGYNFRAPLISPQFYLLGPLSLASGNASVFEENRAWQLAIDAIEYNQTILNTTGLVSYWRLGEASGNPQDSQGTNHVTVVNGSPTYGQTGAIAGDSNTAIDFPADTAYFTVPDATPLDLGDGPFTIEVWARRDVSTAGNEIAFAKLGGGAYGVGTDAVTGKWQLAKVGVETIAMSTASQDLGVWTHWVVTRSGSGAGNTLIYKNGVEGHTDDQIASTLNDTTGLLSIGREGAGNFWNGAIDEIALYNTVLSPATVLDHYNQGIAGNAYEKAVLDDNPAVVFPMDEASGNLTDIIGGKIATPSGTPTYGETGPVSGKTAIDFPTASDFFITPDHNDLDLGNGPFTIEIWARRDSDLGIFQIAANKGTNAYSVGWTDNNDRWELGMVDVQRVATESDGTAADSTWHHFVVTRTNSTTMSVYKDGVDVTTIVSTSLTLQDTTADLVIGREDTTLAVGGALAYLAIYKSVLSQARVQAHYDAAASDTSNFRFNGLKLNGLKIN